MRPLSLLLASWAALGASAFAASMVALNPAADAFVTTGASNELTGNNYGGAGALSIAPAGSAKGELQSLLRFDLGSMVTSFNGEFGVGGWAIQSVTLKLTTATPNNAIFNSPNTAGQFTLQWQKNDSWTEGNGTPMAASTTGGVTFSTLAGLMSADDVSVGTFNYSGATGGLTYTLTLDSSFLSDLAAGGLVSLRAFAASGSTIAYTFNSGNNGNSANWPVLTINAVAIPEPGAGLLCGSGLLLGLVRRRRHAGTT